MGNNSSRAGKMPPRSAEARKGDLEKLTSISSKQNRRRFPFLPMMALVCLFVTALVLLVFFRTVDLKPKVTESFFFSKKDPQLRADNEILRLFPESAQIIVVAAGDIRSPGYEDRIRALSDELASVPGVTSVESLSRGPKNIDDALKSDLWTRLLIAKNEKSSYVFVNVRERIGGETIRRVEAIKRRFDRPGFELTISGFPYVKELIARSLARDLRVFSLAALCIFGVVLFAIFRSLWILMGMLVACADSSAATLIVTEALHIPIGALTANLSTMVFVMTLSPMVFLSFNWRRIRAGPETKAHRRLIEAVKQTVVPSFWSAACMFLGFASLLFVKSTPMQHLGIAGAIGAGMAFASAYIIYPWFLERARPAPPHPSRWSRQLESSVSSFFSRRHSLIVLGIVVFTIVGALGLLRLNTDPDLPSYFKKGGEIRSGLDFVDRTGGSSPLKLVVEDRSRFPLNTKGAYKRLWALQEELEKDPAVGSAMSLPVVLSEAKHHWFSIFFTTEKEIKTLDKPKYGEISRQLVTSDRERALFLLRMRETGRRHSRHEEIARLKSIVERNGFRTVLVGDTYSLLDQMTRLVMSSIVSGVLLLIGIFTVLGFALSRSLRIALAMLVTLFIIPIVVRGYIAYMGMPLDFITASAANLDLGMGVDAMIYLTMFAKREDWRRDPWPAWSKACSHLWRPIGTSLLVICCGFGIFLLSNFPPTQRFGLFVMFGSATAASAALFLFPWLASISRRRKEIEDVQDHVRAA